MSTKDDSILETQAIFTIDVLKQLILSEDEIVFSPYSLTLALAMCYLGARGKTETEFKKFLSPYLEKNEYFRMLKNSIENVHKNLSNLDSISIANRLFLQYDYAVEEKFKVDIENYLAASFENVDFNDCEKSAKIINNFIGNATNNKIRNLVGPNSFSMDTKAIITNALYFKSQWYSWFDKSLTTNGKFYITKSEQKIVKMLNRKSLSLYGSNNSFHIVKLPYIRTNIEFVLILPKERNKLHSLLRKMDRDSFLNVIRPTYSEKVVILTMPKFRIEATCNMKSVLTKMGLILPFNETANFTGITSAENIWIEDVVHKVFVDVTEKGMDVANAVIFKLEGGRLPDVPEEEKIIVQADHPFLYVILNEEKILLSGIYQ